MNFRLLSILGILLLFACKSKDPEPISDFKDYEGIWVPYELIYTEGTVSTGPFYANSFFGVYAESILFQANRQFVPVSWLNEAENQLKTDEAGSFDYYPIEKRIVFKGLWEFEAKIVKYSEDELWLKLTKPAQLQSFIDVYKLKRKK